jgi:putative transposase
MESILAILIGMIFAHKIALDLTEAQDTYCRQAAGTARFTYNWGLAHWQMQYRNGEKPTTATLKKQWNVIKYERYPWLADIHRDAHAQPFTNLHAAFQRFFRNVKDRKAGKTTVKVGYPTFKKKGRHDSFYIANDQCKLQGKRLRIPKLGWVRMREALRFTGKLMSATVSRTADRWYVSLSVQVDAVPSCENQAGRVGVDLGVKHLATLSTGEKIDGPKPLRGALKKLRRTNRELARRVTFSANWYKTKAKLGRLHARIAAIRTDALHKLTTRLTQTFTEVVIEDLHVKGMVQNRTLARAISDMGLGRFRQMLTYKADAYGCRVQVADRWFPSSKLCRVCGVLHDTLTLADRVFVCRGCGHTEDRDVHAALNLERYPGLQGNPTLLESAALAQSGDCVKLRSVKEELQLVFTFEH